jgi:hypothetical protein
MKTAFTSALVLTAILSATAAWAGEGGPDAIGAQGAGSPAAANVSNGATVGGVPGGSSEYRPGFTPEQQRRLNPDFGRSRATYPRPSGR